MSALWLREAGKLPADIALSIIPSLPRAQLERLAQQIIDRLDDMDGDTDVEANGDEQGGSMGEDDFGQPPNSLLGPGCPIADPEEWGGTDLPMVTHDGEDQTVIVLPAPRGIEPTRYRVS